MPYFQRPPLHSP